MVLFKKTPLVGFAIRYRELVVHLLTEGEAKIFADQAWQAQAWLGLPVLRAGCLSLYLNARNACRLFGRGGKAALRVGRRRLTIDSSRRSFAARLNSGVRHVTHL